MEDEPKRIPLKVPPTPKPPKQEPKVGDLIEWVNLLEVWANDKWVDDGGPYFDIKNWNDKLVRRGVILEESDIEGVKYWSVWHWFSGEYFCVSDETDQIRILSECEHGE